MTWDPYRDLESGVLYNKLGITDGVELARVEAALTASRLYDLAQQPLPGRYDLDHLRATHFLLFSDLYSWAGELRTIAIGRGALFCPPGDLLRVGEAIFSGLARVDYLRGLPRPEFVDGLTEFLGALNSLHPFRDGNGRTQRAVVAQLARFSGYRVNWVHLDPEENNSASAAAHRDGDTRRLRQLLDRLVEGPDRRYDGSSRHQPPTPRRSTD